MKEIIPSGGGYQLIEPLRLDPLFGTQAHQIFAVPILCWICDQLRIKLPQLDESIDFCVVNVTRIGSYPAIGIKYKRDHDNVINIVSNAIEEIIDRATMMDIVSYICSKKINWSTVTDKLMNPRCEDDSVLIIR